MDTREPVNTLSGLSVGDAMRRQVIRLSRHAPLSQGIGLLIKYKISALLITGENQAPAGVLSKTDVMGAYYAGLPLDTPAEAIMSSPPLFCAPGDSLENALETMRARSVYRLYVTDGAARPVAGTLAYPDIVGLLYRYCHLCPFSHHGRKRRKADDDAVRRFTVREVMTPTVASAEAQAPLSGVMESLSANRFGALLITAGGSARGVISKTDLVLSYRHGVDPGTPAAAVMTSPVQGCRDGGLLEDAIRKMIFTDLHRLFVHGDDPDRVVGVLSLTDAARRRSGSCHACVTSRIQVGGPGAQVR